MITTSTDDAKLAEISDLLGEMQATHHELVREADAVMTSPPSARILPDWFSFAVVAAIAGGMGVLAGVLLF